MKSVRQAYGCANAARIFCNESSPDPYLPWGGVIIQRQAGEIGANIVSSTGDKPLEPLLRLAPLRRLGLSGKLLLLTIPLVLLAQVLIYVPSIANFRINRLNDRLGAPHTAA